MPRPVAFPSLGVEGASRWPSRARERTKQRGGWHVKGSRNRRRARHVGEFGSDGAGAAAPAKPNILVIFGDDIGQTNLSIYSNGLMGYRTPNIDRIGTEGGAFTDYYAEQSCTAGRSTFITGQVTLRTGMSKVGLPGADVGLQASDATIASALKEQGTPPASSARTTSATRTSSCRPTTASTSSSATSTTSTPRRSRGPQLSAGPGLPRAFGPRGVIKSSADGQIEDTGPLTRKRMETVDDETSAAAIDFMTASSRPTRRSSSGSTPPACTPAPTSVTSIAARRA